MTYIDPTQVSPNVYKEILDNEHVRVLEMTLPAGQSDEMHSHNNETAYFITGSKAKIHMPDGNFAELDIPDGFVMWHEAWTHRVENVGDKPIRAIVVEPK